LAARIEGEFGITPELIGGGGGIYELIINDTVVYSNQSPGCSPIPGDKELFQEIRRYQGG
jgi:predicted Rdx family selenoprotein